MIERFGARVEGKFWNILKNIIIPDSVFSGLRLDKKRLSPSKEILEALIPKSRRNEVFSLPIVFDLRKKPARFNLNKTSSLNNRRATRKKRKGRLLSYSMCLYILIQRSYFKRSSIAISMCIL